MARIPSIRHAFVLLAVLQAVLALLLSISLGGSVTWLFVLARELEHAVQSVRAVEEIQVKIFEATRAHQLIAETGEIRRWQEAQEAAEEQLVLRLGQARSLVESPEERALVGQLEVQVDGIRRNVLAKPPQARTIREAEVLAAQETAQALVELHNSVAAETVERAARWSRIAAAISVATILLTLAGLIVTLRWTRNLLYIPVRRLRRSVSRRKIDSPAHIPEDGPLELRQIAASVNELIDRATAQREQQLTFFASVAHDLRNPMTSLRTAAQLALRQAGSEKQQERVKVILRQVDRMNRLVEDLLEVSRVGAGNFELHLERRDLREVVGDTASLFADTSKRHHLRVDLPAEPVVVEHDSARIAQILSNLISNAIKYAPGGGPIDVRLRVRRDDVEIEVKDRGLGIPPEDRETIFASFGRSPGRADIPGVGLGLAIARRLARAHGGEIELESELGRGSVFRLLLPLR